MDTRPRPGAHLVETTAFEAWHLLGQTEVVRVAWYDGARVRVVPMNHVVADGVLWVRTTSQSAIARAGAGVAVTVEADLLDPADRSGWSVVLHAVVELVDPDAVPDAVGELRVWPEGTRPVYVRLEPTDIAGRRLNPRPGRRVDADVAEVD